MKTPITVKPNAKRSGVEEAGGAIVVFVKSAPIDGKANSEVVRLLARYFRVPQSSVIIRRGGKGRQKLVEIVGK